MGRIYGEALVRLILTLGRVPFSPHLTTLLGQSILTPSLPLVEALSLTVERGTVSLCFLPSRQQSQE